MPSLLNSFRNPFDPYGQQNQAIIQNYQDRFKGMEDLQKGIETQTQSQSNQFLDPNSNYYRKINQQIRDNLSGAFSPDSLLALTMAMGGSPTQAQEQIKAMQGRVGDMAGQLSNQYYLNASSQGTDLLSNLLNYSMGQQGIRQNAKMQDLQNQGSFMNSLFGGALGLFGYGLGGGWNQEDK